MRVWGPPAPTDKSSERIHLFGGPAPSRWSGLFRFWWGPAGWGRGWVWRLRRPPWSLASWHRQEGRAGWSPPGSLLPNPGGEGRVEAQTECPPPRGRGPLHQPPSAGSSFLASRAGRRVWGGHSFRVCRGDGGRASRAVAAPPARHLLCFSLEGLPQGLFFLPGMYYPSLPVANSLSLGSQLKCNLLLVPPPSQSLISSRSLS